MRENDAVLRRNARVPRPPEALALTPFIHCACPRTVPCGRNCEAIITRAVLRKKKQTSRKEQKFSIIREYHADIKREQMINTRSVRGFAFNRVDLSSERLFNCSRLQSTSCNHCYSRHFKTRSSCLDYHCRYRSSNNVV